MKGLVALPLAAAVSLLSGCSGAPGEEGGPNPHVGGQPSDASSAAEGALAAQGGTASVFPFNTPPTNRESITPPNYWVPKKENTHPVHEGEPAYGGDTQG